MSRTLSIHSQVRLLQPEPHYLHSPYACGSQKREDSCGYPIKFWIVGSTMRSSDARDGDHSPCQSDGGAFRALIAINAQLCLGRNSSHFSPKWGEKIFTTVIIIIITVIIIFTIILSPSALASHLRMMWTRKIPISPNAHNLQGGTTAAFHGRKRNLEGVSSIVPQLPHARSQFPGPGLCVTRVVQRTTGCQFLPKTV